MGEVYLGKSPGGRLVAIKLIRPDLAEERGFRSRFASEISAARNVSGIYTAAVVDADADAELPWMATVYVPGPSLTDAVEDNGPLPVDSVLALAAGLAEALQAIHRVGLVHRDLKPSNVLLATDGPRVIDFGISLALERSMMTATGMVMGSPGFMSPEQARGQREVGAPTDVFSLGAVLAFAATGNGPFGTGPTPALLYRVVSEPPDLTGVPDRLSALIGQCLAKDPAERPTPTEILATLGDEVEVLTGEWLPPMIAASMSRYSPTTQTPLPPALKEPDQAQPAAAAAAALAASSGLASSGLASSRPASPVPTTPAPYVPAAAAAGGIGYEPTTLEPAIGAGRATSPGAGAPAATRYEQALPDTSLVPVSGPLLLGSGGGASIPPFPPRRPPSRGRGRWGWLIAAGAAVAIVAVAAVLLLSHKPAGGKGGGGATASLAGDATQPASTSSSNSLSPSPTPSKSATKAAPSKTASSNPVTQPTTTYRTSSPTATKSSSPTTSPTTSTSATPTTSTSATPTTSTSATPTTAAPTPTTAAPTPTAT
jgi:hypothetical protein